MARTYESTHPWLSFGLDTTLFDYKLWMALGEASSKCEHIAGVPLAPDVAQQMHRLYLVKGAAATTAIEGNTLSEDEAAKVLEGKLTLPPSQQYLAKELENIVEACNLLTTRIGEEGNAGVTIDLLKEINRIVLKDLRVEDGVVPGEVRQHKVVVGKYRCAPVEDCDFLLERLCEVLNSFPCPKDGKNQFCIIKAAFAHLYFVWIHPFGDGNGRTARLLELFILLSAGLAQPTGHLLSNHYNRTRPEYYEKLSQAIHGSEGVVNFISYSVGGLVEGLREQISYIRSHQWHVSWLNYVHERFHDKNSATDVRRRHLVLALSIASEEISISKLTNLSPDLAREYYGKTHKTIVRDINALVGMDLIVRRRGTIRAKRETILAFLPWRAPDDEDVPFQKAA